MSPTIPGAPRAAPPWPPRLHSLHALVPAGLRPEAVLGALVATEHPIEALLDLALLSLDARWAAVLPVGSCTTPGLRARARRGGGTADWVPQPQRLVDAELRDRVLVRREAILDASGAGVAGVWRGAAPVLAAPTPPARGSRPPCGDASRHDILGGLVMGGRRSELHPALRDSSASLLDVLRWLSIWLGLALRLERGADPAAAGGALVSAAAIADPVERADFPGIITASPALVRVLETIRRVAPTDAAVLIEGESGTGKELVARALHRLSPRRRGPFLSENCAACPASLLESEFFGVERGAFTGASISKPGVFERADGGTLFLDEVGEMDMQLQTKLLRVLQERECRRVGGQQSIRVDFRLVSATNRSLEAEISRQRFRLDLLYRIEVVKVRLPPLRERVADVPHLARHFLEVHSDRLGRPVPAIHPAAMRALLGYRWPGNVRELQNEMWRAVALGHAVLLPRHLSAKIHGETTAQPASAPDDPPWFDYDSLERDILGGLLRAALARHQGNTTRAAAALGMARTSFYRRARRFGIDVRRAAGAGDAAELAAAYARLAELVRSSEGAGS